MAEKLNGTGSGVVLLFWPTDITMPDNRFARQTGIFGPPR